MILEVGSGLGPIDLYDADGAEIKDCVFADTEVGYVLQCNRNDMGHFTLGDDGECSKIGSLRPAPLRAVIRGEKKARPTREGQTTRVWP